MRLADFNPRWVGLHNFDANSIFHIGISFDDPTKPSQRLAILFKPPIDPNGLAVKYGWGEPFPTAKKWDRTGETFDTLTITPSLDFSEHGYWHGSITNGNIT